MIAIPMEPVLAWILVFLRAAFLIGFFPLFGEGFVPVRVRIFLAAMTALVLAPVVPVTADQFPNSMSGLVGTVASEALLGFSVGLIGRALFAVVQFAGQIGGEQMGFGIINAIDPTSGHQISVIAEMQYLMAVMLFLATGMHRVMISAVAVSFDLLQPGQAAFSAGVTAFFMDLGGTIFSLALQFAMPVIIVILMINFSMALVGRAVPQVNVFLESFPLRIIGGVTITIATLGVLASLWTDMFSGLDDLVANLMRLLAG